MRERGAYHVGMNNFPAASVSVIALLPDRLAYPLAEFSALIRSALDQDYAPQSVIVADGRGPTAALDFMPAGADASRVRHIRGDYATRAALLAAAFEAVDTDFALLVYCDQAAIRLRRSCLATMLMAATRVAPPRENTPELGQAPHARVALVGPAAALSAEDRPVGLVYADYERIEADGQRRDVHLLDLHAGRLRDTLDLGAVWLCPTAALRGSGGFDASLKAADMYDLRLKLSERYAVSHIANRYAGALYGVTAPARAHNVFDYLLAGKDVQLELERVCTEHLRRSGAYLAPGAHTRRVEYTAAEQARFADCLASVVTPVNRRPQFIGRAIESVQAQSERRVEMIVVVNGGADDPTADEVRRYMPGGDRYDESKPPVRLIVVDVNNLGLCLNSGIAAARGKFYVQLDSDDRLKPDAVERLLAVFDSDATIGMVVGSYEVWTLDERSGALRRNEEVPVVTHDEWTADNGRNNLLRINGAGAPRAAHVKVIRDAGWFGVNDTPACRNYGEDYDLVLRISERYTIGRVWAPIYEVIRHAGGTDHAIDQGTIDRNDSAKDAMRLEALRRRQALNRAR